MHKRTRVLRTHDPLLALDSPIRRLWLPSRDSVNFLREVTGERHARSPLHLVSYSVNYTGLHVYSHINSWIRLHSHFHRRELIFIRQFLFPQPQERRPPCTLQDPHARKLQRIVQDSRRKLCFSNGTASLDGARMESSERVSGTSLAVLVSDIDAITVRLLAADLQRAEQFAVFGCLGNLSQLLNSISTLKTLCTPIGFACSRIHCRDVVSSSSRPRRVSWLRTIVLCKRDRPRFGLRGLWRRHPGIFRSRSL